VKKGKLILLVGASGSGKDSILNGAKALDSRYAKLVTSTTREPRDGEKDGVDYHFLTIDEMMNIHQVANVKEPQEVHGNYYTYSFDDIDYQVENGDLLTFIVDLPNALDLKIRYPDAVIVYVTPPNEEELYNRLKNRGTESKESLNRRMRDAQREIQSVFHNKAIDRFIVNDNLEKAINQFVEFTGGEK